MMKEEFLKKEDNKFRESQYWSLDEVAVKDPLLYLLSSECFPRDYQGILDLDKKWDQERRAKEETEVKFTRFVLRILEVADFWERILGDKNSNSNETVKRLRGGYKFLLEELATIGVRPDGPSIGDFPRRGKDIVEGKKEHNDLPAGVICEVIKKTYLWNDKVLRESRVIVVKPKKEL